MILHEITIKISDPKLGVVDKNGACNKQNKSKSLFSLATKTYAMIASNRVKKVCHIYTIEHIWKYFLMVTTNIFVSQILQFNFLVF